MAGFIDVYGRDRVELLLQETARMPGRVEQQANMLALLCELWRRRKPVPTMGECVKLAGIHTKNHRYLAVLVGYLALKGFIAEQYVEHETRVHYRPGGGSKNYPAQLRYIRPRDDALTAYLDGVYTLGRRRRA